MKFKILELFLWEGLKVYENPHWVSPSSFMYSFTDFIETQYDQKHVIEFKGVYDTALLQFEDENDFLNKFSIFYKEWLRGENDTIKYYGSTYPHGLNNVTIEEENNRLLSFLSKGLKPTLSINNTTFTRKELISFFEEDLPKLVTFLDLPEDSVVGDITLTPMVILSSVIEGALFEFSVGIDGFNDNIKNFLGTQWKGFLDYFEETFNLMLKYRNLDSVWVYGVCDLVWSLEPICELKEHVVADTLLTRFSERYV